MRGLEVVEDGKPAWVVKEPAGHDCLPAEVTALVGDDVLERIDLDPRRVFDVEQLLPKPELDERIDCLTVSARRKVLLR